MLWRQMALLNSMTVKKWSHQDSYSTPEYLYKALDMEFAFDLDPCPLNPEFDPEVHQDGLKLDWDGEKCRIRCKVNREKYKQIVYEHYGEQCFCCKETEPLFLTIDHKNNDGWKEAKKSANLYYRIIKAGFPDSYRIACYNCNCGRARNGGICPHATC